VHESDRKKLRPTDDAVTQQVQKSTGERRVARVPRSQRMPIGWHRGQGDRPADDYLVLQEPFSSAHHMLDRPTAETAVEDEYPVSGTAIQENVMHSVHAESAVPQIVQVAVSRREKERIESGTQQPVTRVVDK
jgi:hypothetical protein